MIYVNYLICDVYVADVNFESGILAAPRTGSPAMARGHGTVKAAEGRQDLRTHHSEDRRC